MIFKKNHFILWIVCLVQPLYADTLGLEFFGLSSHLSEGVRAAPRKLDAAGVHVFNPGLGIDYDWRASNVTPGLSAVVRAGFFKQCTDMLSFYAGAGGRYRTMLNENWLIGGSVLAGVYYIQPIHDLTPLIVPTFEIGRKIYDDHIAKFNLSYAPVLNLLLTTVTLSYSL